MNFIHDENGQGLVEYGLIIGFIAVVAIVLIIALGDKISANFQTANDALTED